MVHLGKASKKKVQNLGRCPKFGYPLPPSELGTSLCEIFLTQLAELGPAQPQLHIKKIDLNCLVSPKLKKIFSTRNCNKKGYLPVKKDALHSRSRLPNLRTGNHIFTLFLPSLIPYQSPHGIGNLTLVHTT